MYLKQYRRKTLREALRAVREDLGPTALVLSTRLVRVAGPRGWVGAQEVEVTAARDRHDMSETRQVEPMNRTGEQGVNEIAARLGASGMEPAVARALATSHPANRRRGAGRVGLHATLTERLGSLAAPDDDFASVEMFVGPPGVGKTTTIAKIAAQERAKHGRRLGLLAADGYRVGAVEQLRLFAEIIGSPITVARTAEELDTALSGARRPLLLDTAGRSPSDGVSREMFRVVARRPDARTHLVMAASTPADSILRTVERFGDTKPSRIVLTRLDEVESLAPLVGALQECAIPISFVGTGQRVPEDLYRATPSALASWVTGDATWREVTA